MDGNFLLLTIAVARMVIAAFMLVAGPSPSAPRNWYANPMLAMTQGTHQMSPAFCVANPPSHTHYWKKMVIHRFLMSSVLLACLCVTSFVHAKEKSLARVHAASHDIASHQNNRASSSKERGRIERSGLQH